MAPALAQFLRAKLADLDWSYAKAAAKAGVPKTTISNIINNPDRVPDLHTLNLLARALDVPMAELITLAGFTMDEAGPPPKDQQIMILLREMPELRDILAEVMVLTPEDLQAIRAFLAGARWKSGAS